MFRIKEILREKGLTQLELASMLGVSPQYISGVIREVDSVSVSALGRIAAVLNVPVSSLFSDYTQTTDSLVCPSCGARLKLVVE